MAKTTDTASGDDAKIQQRNWKSFGNLIRMAERLATLQHPVDEAHAWAEGTLSKAGLPTVPGLYALGADGGLTLVVPRQGAAFLCADFDAGHEWQLPLHKAILKLDRGRTLSRQSTWRPGCWRSACSSRARTTPAIPTRSPPGRA